MPDKVFCRKCKQEIIGQPAYHNCQEYCRRCYVLLAYPGKSENYYKKRFNQLRDLESKKQKNKHGKI